MFVLSIHLTLEYWLLIHKKHSPCERVKEFLSKVSWRRRDKRENVYQVKRCHWSLFMEWFRSINILWVMFEINKETFNLVNHWIRQEAQLKKLTIFGIFDFVWRNSKIISRTFQVLAGVSMKSFVPSMTKRGEIEAARNFRLPGDAANFVYHTKCPGFVKKNTGHLRIARVILLLKIQT